VLILMQIVHGVSRTGVSTAWDDLANWGRPKPAPSRPCPPG